MEYFKPIQPVCGVKTENVHIGHEVSSATENAKMHQGIKTISPTLALRVIQIEYIIVLLRER
jgi:hypothetical protein